MYAVVTHAYIESPCSCSMMRGIAVATMVWSSALRSTTTARAASVSRLSAGVTQRSVNLLFFLPGPLAVAERAEHDRAAHRVAGDRAGVIDLQVLALHIDVDAEGDRVALDRAVERHLAARADHLAAERLARLREHRVRGARAHRAFDVELPRAGHVRDLGSSGWRRRRGLLGRRRHAARSNRCDGCEAKKTQTGDTRSGHWKTPFVRAP